MAHFIASVYFNNEREFGCAISEVERLGQTDNHVAVAFDGGHISVRKINEVFETVDGAYECCVQEIESRRAKLLEAYDKLLADAKKRRDALASAAVVG